MRLSQEPNKQFFAQSWRNLAQLAQSVGHFFCELLLPLGFSQRVPKFFLVFTVFRFPWLSSSFPDFSEVSLRFSSGSSQVFPTWLTPRVLVPKGKPVIRKQLCSARKFILLNLGRNLGSRHFLVAVGILFCMIGFGRIVIDHLYSYYDGSRRLGLLHQVGSLVFLSPFLVSFNSFKWATMSSFQSQWVPVCLKNLAGLFLDRKKLALVGFDK